MSFQLPIGLMLQLYPPVPFSLENTPVSNQAVPSGTVGCYVTLIGGGGAGGVGGGVFYGGGGGGGGGGRVNRTFIPIASLGTTYSVSVGSGGGSSGASGTASTFSSSSVALSAGGGSGGGAAQSGAAGTSGPGGTCSVSGVSATTANGTSGGVGGYQGPGFAPGNGVSDTTNDVGCGGGGGTYNGWGYGTAGRGGNSNTVTGGAGGDDAGTHPTGYKPLDASAGHGGAGGGGGDGASSTAGTGGNGGLYGGGGGGGGTVTQGEGGWGAQGYTLVEWVNTLPPVSYDSSAISTAQSALTSNTAFTFSTTVNGSYGVVVVFTNYTSTPQSPTGTAVVKIGTSTLTYKGNITSNNIVSASVYVGPTSGSGSQTVSVNPMTSPFNFTGQAEAHTFNYATTSGTLQTGQGLTAGGAATQSVSVTSASTHLVWGGFAFGNAGVSPSSFSLTQRQSQTASNPSFVTGDTTGASTVTVSDFVPVSTYWVGFGLDISP